MKIKWIGPSRRVKGLGILKEDDTRNVDKTTGDNLIKQGLAVEHKEVKKKRREVI